ncbi:hypothetical protein CVT25_013143 [Psilocybe cyanescens]|uniref:Uncharacterized protein n=1 Tax=Psilocybe cyanescens TaxID=93625 RepID=A0A409XK06_PSICY|nr:hypothetical protein CVT25_013143 [Psilocybe cyanescens]
MSKYLPKNISTNPKERPNHSNLVEEESLESEKPRQTPRFSSDTVGRRQTAKKHSFSMPDRMGHQNSDGPDRFIPGAFPAQKSDPENDPKHLDTSSRSERHGVRVGTGLMLQDDADNTDEVDSSQLPTSEQPSLSRVGVGSLPGTIKESGVAILPEERIHPDPYLRGYTAPDASTSIKGGKQENRPDKKEFELPTTEKPSGSRVGIGSMPGANSEGGVATLPEERIDGRPYGSGHTGFEDTLGRGHTIRLTHPPHNVKPTDDDAKARQAPHAKTTVKPESKSYTKIVVDDKARKALHEQNPVRAPLTKNNTFPFTSPSSHEQTLPGDTIFSATQRARAHDPNFIHGSRGQTFSDRPVDDSATTTPGQRSKMAQNRAAQGEQGLQNAAQVGASVFESVEDAAIGAMHGAEHVFHDIESSARAYFPDVSKQGAQNMLHNIETGAKAHMPNVSAYFRSGGSSAAQDSQRNPALGTSGSSAKNAGSFTTIGADAPHSKSHSKSKDFATLSSQKNQPTDKDITESMKGTQISERISRRPKGIEHEYFKGSEFDVYGERLDTHQFIYDDDLSTEEDENSIRSLNSDHPPSTDNFERDLASDHARGSYAPGDSSARAKNASPDVLYGHGGVGYYRQGKDGILPGYPTAEGMNKLISDRLKDDHLRATGDANPPKEKSYVNSGTSSAMQGPIAEGVSVDTDHYDDDITLVRRDPEEVKEIPIFKGGMPSASGKFEAVFEPVSGQRHGQDSKTTESSSTGRYGSLIDSDSKWKQHQASQDIPTTGGVKIGYLGKPISEKEEAIEIERARRAAARRMGID